MAKFPVGLLIRTSGKDVICCIGKSWLGPSLPTCHLALHSEFPLPCPKNISCSAEQTTCTPLITGKMLFEGLCGWDAGEMCKIENKKQLEPLAHKSKYNNRAVCMGSAFTTIFSAVPKQEPYYNIHVVTLSTLVL